MSRFWYLLNLAGKSAWNRKSTLVLVVFAIAISTTLLIGIERVRSQLRQSFVQAISGTDLVVGARGNGVQLILYAVFHIGSATTNMGWDSAQRIAARDDVAWTVPISLGDSHRGFPVVGTTQDYFTYYRYQRNRELQFARGARFNDIFDVVLGAGVARQTGYALGNRLTLTHGTGQGASSEHADMPFVITGILAPTGTPVDNSLYISLECMEAIHLGWQGGVPIPGFKIQTEQVTRFNLTPKAITALFVGLKNRARVFAVQRDINTDTQEALMGVMPGVALDQLWGMLNTGETALLLISGLVTVAGLAGLASAIMAGLGERRRELAIFRSSGASPKDVVTLLALEGMLLMLTGVLIGLAALFAFIAWLGPVLAQSYGIGLYLTPLTSGEWTLLGGIVAAGFLTSLIPALRAYRMSLADGLTVST
jgi:putative ABC transport system permease protein